MKLTEYAIERPHLVATIITCLTSLGIFAFFEIPRAEDPAITFRYGLIETIYPGASTDQMDQSVAKKIEASLKAVSEVEFVESRSAGSVTVSVIKVHDSHSALNQVWDDIHRVLKTLRDKLPDTVHGPFLREDFADIYNILITVASEKNDYKLLQDKAVALSQDLAKLESVANIKIIGKREEQIRISYDDSILIQNDLSPLQLRDFIRTQNVIVPGGTIPTEAKNHFVETATQMESIEALKGLLLPFPTQGKLTRLEDAFTIEREFIEPASAHLTAYGKPALGVAVSMRKGENSERLGRAVNVILAQHASDADKRIHFDTMLFEPERITFRINRFFKGLLQSLIAVVIVVVIGLGLRSGSIVALGMPLIILTVLALLYLSGQTLDFISIAAFTVALGMMVDTHIVIAERIVFLRERGSTAREASIKACQQLHGPLLTAALTTITGFLPVFLTQSAAGDYLSPLFIGITLLLLCSELYAFTFTPLLSTYWSSEKKRQPPSQSHQKPFYANYRHLLTQLLRRPWLPLLLITLIIIAAIYSFRLLPKVFFPPSDRPIFSLELEWAGDTSIDFTREQIKTIDTFIEETLFALSEQEASIRRWASFVGQTPPRFVLNQFIREHSPEYAYVLFELHSHKDFEKVREQLNRFCRDQFTDAMVRVRKIETGPPVGWPIKIRIQGDEQDAVIQTAAKIKMYLGTIEGLENVNDNWGEPVPKVHVIPNREQLNEQRISGAEVALAVQHLTTGIPVTVLQENDTSLPVILKTNTTESTPEAKIQSAWLYPSRVDPLMLNEVAEVKTVDARPFIMRRDQQYSLMVRADVRPGVSAQAIDALITSWLASQKEEWDEGVHVQLSGEGSEAQTANSALLSHLPLAGIIILLLLIWQTRSFRSVLIILSVVPLGVIGSIFGLLLLRQSFGFMTLVGMIALAGIVINNAIILIDRIDHNLRCHLSLQESIVEASISRLRPILLTTLTTIAGISTLYLRDDALWNPMATVLIFGLIFSTIIILFWVPTLYMLFFRVSFSKELR